MKASNSIRNIVELPKSFDFDSKNFVLNLPKIGEVKVQVDNHCQGLAYTFGLTGYVSNTGYKSMHLYSQQLEGYNSPEEIAEILIYGLYEKEGREYQLKRIEEEGKSRQLSLF